VLLTFQSSEQAGTEQTKAVHAHVGPSKHRINYSMQRRVTQRAHQFNHSYRSCTYITPAGRINGLLHCLFSRRKGQPSL